MNKKRVILLTEIVNKETNDYNVVAVFDDENAVDVMTKYFNEIAGYEIKIAEAIVDKLLGTLFEDISEIVNLDNDWCIQCIVSEYYFE